MAPAGTGQLAEAGSGAGTLVVFAFGLLTAGAALAASDAWPLATTAPSDGR